MDEIIAKPVYYQEIEMIFKKYYYIQWNFIF